ncbi:MAG: hypothetical protein IKV63_04730 [Clostridia bacterium]|nr:hypothetical protein [Clostridia bacterium]
MKKNLYTIIALTIAFMMVFAGCSAKEEATEATTAAATEATTAATEATTAATEAATEETTSEAETEATEATTAATEATTAATVATKNELTTASTAATVATTEAPKPAAKADLVAIMNKLYDGLTPGEDCPMVGQMEIDGESSAYYVGIENLSCKQALASEAMIGAIAHSLVLIEVEDGTDIASLKAEIRENINPRKWICVGVERDEVVIENVGNIVFVCIEANMADHFRTQFFNVVK